MIVSKSSLGRWNLFHTGQGEQIRSPQLYLLHFACNESTTCAYKRQNNKLCI